MQNRSRQTVALIAIVARAIVAIAILAVGCTLPQSTPRVVMRTGKVHGLVNFVQAIRGDAHRSPVLVELFEASELDNATTAALLDDFDRARSNLEHSVSFDGYPNARHAGRSMSGLFLIQSGFARDLDDLRDRTLGMLPQAEHSALFRALDALEPIYDQLVWEPQRKQLESYRRRLVDLSRDWNVEELFEAAARFYGAEWPDDMPFTVVLYPLPGAQGNTSAESIGSFESVGVLVEEEDLAGRFGVIFHEMSHSLFEAQPAELQQELERLFLDSPSPHARLAYEQINEALATAMGNGWAYVKATGKEDTGSWYNDERVDRFSKGIYPVVAKYVANGWTLDAGFVEESIEIFEKLFPDATHEYDLLLNKIVLMVDGQSIRPAEATDALRTRFRVSSVSSSAPIDHELSLATVGDGGETLVVVVTPNTQQQLEGLARAYAPLAAHLPELRNESRDFVYSRVDTQGRAWIVIKVSDAELLPRIVEQLGDRIDPTSPMHVLAE